MRNNVFILAAAISSISGLASAQAVKLPLLGPGSTVGTAVSMVTASLPSPLTSSAALPLDVTVLENGANGSGYSQVLALGSGIPATIIGNQLNNTLGTPLVGLPTGTAQPVDVAVLGGDGVGNTNSSGLLGVATLSGSNTAQGGLLGVGIINDANTGQGSLVGLGALSGNGSGTSSNGLGVSILNQGNPLTVTAAGTTVVSLTNLAGTGRGSLPGLDQGGVALGGTSPVASSNPLLNVGALTGDNAGSGGLIGVAALSGNNAAHSSLVAVGLLNGSGSANAPVAVDVLSGNGSGVSAQGIGAAVLSGNGSGNGGAIGAGVLTGSNSGGGGTLGAGVLSGTNSGTGGTLGAGVLAGPGSGSGLGGGTGLTVVGSNTGSTGTGSSGSTPNGASTNGNFTYSSQAAGNQRSAAADPCKVGYRDASGKMVRPFECAKKAEGNT